MPLAGFTNLNPDVAKFALNGVDKTTLLTQLFNDAAKLQLIATQNDVRAISTETSCGVSGVNVVAGGTGLALTLAAPTPGCRCEILLASITSGNVVVTTAAGVTFNGTNNTATFNAANDRLVMVYKSATEWQIVLNTSVDLSTV